MESNGAGESTISRLGGSLSGKMSRTADSGRKGGLRRVGGVDEALSRLPGWGE